MYSLRKDDREAWDFIFSNFCCNKTTAPLEQVNKELKVMGGIVAVGLSGDGIDKYCLTAPIKRLILAKFEESIRLNKTSSDSDYIHHKYSGSYLKFQIYAKHLRSFLDCDLTTVQTVLNVMTHYVLTLEA